jgi:DNA polymerase-3 subunit epsilon
METARHHGIVLPVEQAHGAAADALASARVAWKLARIHGELGAMALPELHERQVGWFAEQAASLAEYFARQGKTEPVPTEWPLRPVPAVVS